MAWFDGEIKKIDVENACFPLFITEEALTKEKDHVEGFAAEVCPLLLQSFFGSRKGSRQEFVCDRASLFLLLFKKRRTLSRFLKYNVASLQASFKFALGVRYCL